MMAKNIAIFLVCFALAGGIINSTGIFTPVENINIDAENYTNGMSNGITELENGSVRSSEDISSTLDGWSMIASTYGTVKQMFSILILPGSYLIGIGVNTGFAIAIQVIINIITLWGLIQFVTNRSTRNQE